MTRIVDSILRRLMASRAFRPLQVSLQRRISASVLVVSSLTVALVALLAYRQNTAGLQGAVADRLDGIANRRVTDVQRWVKDELAGIGFVAGLSQVASDAETVLRNGPDAAAAHRRLSAALRSAASGRIGAENVFVLSAIGGRVIASIDTTRLGTYHTSELYFEEGLKGPYVQNVYPSARTGRPALTVAAPIRRDADSMVVAVLVAHLDLRRMDELVVQPTGPLPVEVYLVNRYAEFVTSERFGRPEFRRGVHTVGIDSALAGHDGQGSYRNYDGVPVIGAFRWMPKQQLALLVESPQHHAFAPARRALLTILLTGTIAIGLLAWAIQWVTRRTVSPILEVTRAAQRVAAGDLETEAPVVTEDEVGVLARSFNSMTAHLRTLYTDLNDQVAATSRMVDALQKNRTLMQSIVDNSTAAIAVVGFSDQLLLVNRQLAEISLEGQKASVGKRLADIFREDNAATMRAACQAVRATKTPVELELQIDAADGRRLLLALCFPLFDAGGVPYAIGVIATDHTERRRAEEERLALEAQVRHSQKLESLGVMAGGIAHDFNNILGAVLGHAELAMDGLDNPAEARASLEQVIAATRRASDLTRQMLAYAGKASFGKNVIEVNRIVQEISELASVSVSKKIRVVHEFSPDPTWILADGAQLSQVILNLLTNAADAIGDREGSITVTTSVAGLSAAQVAESFAEYPLPAGRYVRLTVTDTGVGMSAATLERIFDPFFTTKASGRGLGLAAVLGIVRSSGGGLAVHSTPGAGTSFEVVFPAQSAPEPARGPGPDSSQVAVERRMVLVADDELMLRNIASRALRRAGFDVIEAADGLEAWELYSQYADHVSVIVLDMTMPRMSGQEVLAAIRQRDSGIPVILSSGYDSQDSAATRAADPRVQFLQKPYAPRELVQRVVEAARTRPDTDRLTPPSRTADMKLAAHQVARLESFLDRIANDTYPEAPSGLHDEITASMLERVLSTCALPDGASVLDVGCGQGVALKRFAERRLQATGITLNPVDVAECRRLGYNVLEMDQSFLEFPDASFDLVWCRHCIEHSVFPYFTLSQFHRVMRPGGWLYIEVPAPDTACAHQTNGNHYSVLGKNMWASLISRAGFTLVDVMDIDFSVPAGPDQYWAFIGRRA